MSKAVLIPIEKYKEGAEILFKSNALIKGNVDITSAEYKVFNKILYKCQREKDNEQQMVAKLTMEELQQIVKRTNDNTPKGLLTSLEKFMKIPIRFKYNNEFVSTSLINTVKIDEDTMDFKCYLNREMYEVLTGYKELGYSPIDLKLVRNANGYYTQRFYELFRVWSNTKKEVTYTVKELKTWLMIEEGNSYDRYYNFKKKVIEPSLKEISEKLNMDVEFEEIKNGRSVIQVKFKILDKEPRVYQFELDEEKLNDSGIKTNPPKTEKKSYPKTSKKKDLKFNNFKAREYDYEVLERKLLGWDNDEEEEEKNT